MLVTCSFIKPSRGCAGWRGGADKITRASAPCRIQKNMRDLGCSYWKVMEGSLPSEEDPKGEFSLESKRITCVKFYFQSSPKGLF